MNFSRLLYWCLFGSSFFHGIATWAAVTGKVVLDGLPPAEMEITPLMRDPSCGRAYSSGSVPTTRHHVVGPDGGLANVLVSVEGGERWTRTATAVTGSALVDQVGCLFEPYVLGVVTGQVVRFRNSDPHLHNVQLEESKAGNRPFNFTQPSAGMVTEKTFEHGEVFLKLKCLLHPWMFSYVGVLEHPFYAVTDAAGNFSVAGLPDGRHTLVFQHPKAGRVTEDIEVAGGVSLRAIRVAMKPGAGTPGPAIRPKADFDSAGFPTREPRRPLPTRGAPANSTSDDRDRAAAQRQMEYELRQLEIRTSGQVLRLQLEALSGGAVGARSAADEIQRLRSGAAAEAEAIRQKYQRR